MLTRDQKVKILLTQEKILNERYNKQIHIISASYNDEERIMTIRCTIEDKTTLLKLNYDDLYYEK